MSELIRQTQFARFFADGHVEFATHPEGLPEFEYLLPMAYTPADEQTFLIQQAHDNYAMNGLLVVKQDWVKNQLFDRKKQKTTARFIVRVCKDQDEMDLVFRQILEAVKRIETVLSEKRGAA